MTTLSIRTLLGNAFARFCGRFGDVTRQAHAHDCSRQTVYNHAQLVHTAIEVHLQPGPSREQLLATNAQLAAENARLHELCSHAVDCPESMLVQFATAATAMGLSLSQIVSLLAILLTGSRLPSRATVGRWVQRSARRASCVLAALDRVCQPHVTTLAADEIFCSAKPVLMAVEPHSMTWVAARCSADRTGASWAVTLQVAPVLQDVVTDGGTGLAKGLDLFDKSRQAQAQTSDNADTPRVRLHVQSDVFHIMREGKRAVRRLYKRAESAMASAAKLERLKAKKHSTDEAKQQASQMRAEAWAKAEALLEVAHTQEGAWKRAVAALQVIKPDGSLNERVWARGELRGACKQLTAEEWAKVRRALADANTLTYVDRMTNKLGEVEPNRERLEGLVRIWDWYRQTGKGEASSAVREVEGLVIGVIVGKLGAGWEETYKNVAQVLGSVVRASSSVECVNSVVRMHQARHRQMSQGMLDLKRLYWNCRAFREGKRKGKCPYELLKLTLPTYQAWDLLSMDVAHLR